MTTPHVSSSPKTDAALLDAIKQPNAELPWQKFVSIYHGMIERWARTAQFDEDETMDLLGEIYLRLVPRLRRFTYNPNRRFRSWLRKVVKSSIAEVCQRRSRTVVCGTGSTSSARLLSNFPEPSLEEEFVEDFDSRMKHAREIVKKVRKRFGRKTWKAFELTCIEGMSCSEAAEKLDMPIGSLYVARSRVTTALRNEGLHDDAKVGLPFPK